MFTTRKYEKIWKKYKFGPHFIKMEIFLGINYKMFNIFVPRSRSAVQKRFSIIKRVWKKIRVNRRYRKKDPSGNLWRRALANAMNVRKDLQRSIMRLRNKKQLRCWSNRLRGSVDRRKTSVVKMQRWTTKEKRRGKQKPTTTRKKRQILIFSLNFQFAIIPTTFINELGYRSIYFLLFNRVQLVSRPKIQLEIENQPLAVRSDNQRPKMLSWMKQPNLRRLLSEMRKKQKMRPRQPSRQIQCRFLWRKPNHQQKVLQCLLARLGETMERKQQFKSKSFKNLTGSHKK